MTDSALDLSFPIDPNALDALRQAMRQAVAHLVERQQTAELLILGLVAREHVLLIGPPGTGKSRVVRQICQTVGGAYFEYLIGRFTEPTELFGAVNLQALREGQVVTDTRGMLPEADIVFLDEIFLGSTAILNTLLGVLNERQFRRGQQQIACPLRLCVGAANQLPQEGQLAAFADRFLLTHFVQPVPTHALDQLLTQGWALADTPTPVGHYLPLLDQLHHASRQVELAQIRPTLIEAIQRLRQAHITLSDRRIVKLQNLIAAATVLAGRQQAEQGDLWPLAYALPNEMQQEQVRDILQDLLVPTTNSFLQQAAEQAVLQPQARLSRLHETSLQLLVNWDKDTAQQTLYEIEANFQPNEIPEPIQQTVTLIRQRLAQAGNIADGSVDSPSA